MDAIITINPEVMHGEPCFAGTRVTLKTLFDHLRGGYSIAEFLDQFPSVRREQVLSLLDAMHRDAVRAAVPA